MQLGKYIRRKNTFKGKKYTLVELPFWTVKEELPNAFASGDVFKAVEIVTGVYERSQEALSFGLYLLDSLEEVFKMENETLATKPNKKMIDAGVERMNIFGNMNVIRSLSKNILDHDKIKQLPYERVFEELLAIKIENEIERAYNEHD